MVSFDTFKSLDLRVAEIIEVREHPNADKLYVLTVNVGDETKQIVAGIRSAYTKEELKGKKIVVINNLDPVVLRGEESRGMLLAAGTENGPVVLMPSKDVPAGSIVK